MEVFFSSVEEYMQYKLKNTGLEIYKGRNNEYGKIYLYLLDDKGDNDTRMIIAIVNDKDNNEILKNNL